MNDVDIYDVVHGMESKGDRLRQARKAAKFKSAADAARRLGMSPSTYGAHENGQNEFYEEDAIRYGALYGVPWEWLLAGEQTEPPVLSSPNDGTVTTTRPPGAFRMEPVEAPRMSDTLTPVYGLAVGGEDGRFFFNGETIGWVKTPESLLGIKNVYVLYVAEESMVPRFKPGEQVWVNPHRTPIRGDDVIVQLHPEHEGEPPEGYIKEFRAWSPKKLHLWQWNPAQEFEVDRALVKSVHVILGRGLT